MNLLKATYIKSINYILQLNRIKITRYGRAKIDAVIVREPDDDEKITLLKTEKGLMSSVANCNTHERINLRPQQFLLSHRPPYLSPSPLTPQAGDESKHCCDCIVRAIEFKPEALSFLR